MKHKWNFTCNWTEITHKMMDWRQTVHLDIAQKKVSILKMLLFPGKMYLDTKLIKHGINQIVVNAIFIVAP